MPTSKSKRDLLFELEDTRKAVQNRIAAEHEILKAKGVGMNDSLVDAEGFPRADIDIYGIRQSRQNISRLRNDFKAISDECQALMHDIYTDINVNQQVSTTTATITASPESEFEPEPRPAVVESTHQTSTNSVAFDLNDNSSNKLGFAKITGVGVDSPGWEAGLLSGDIVSALGKINKETFKNLVDVGKYLQKNENKTLKLYVHRRDKENNSYVEKKLDLTPKQWPGTGLLGCHMVPI